MIYVLFVLFVLVPFLDLLLLLKIGDVFGFWPTVAFTLAVGALGAWLTKREGMRVLRAWQRAIAELRPPSQGVIDGVLVIAGGALLIAPGVLTDLVGLVFLIPFTRAPVAALVRRWVDRKIARSEIRVATSFDGAGGSGSAPRSDVVDTTGESIGEAKELPRRGA